MVCKRWSRWSFAKKRGLKPVLARCLVFGWQRWSGGGHWWSGGGHKKCDSLQETPLLLQEMMFYSKGFNGKKA